MIGALALLCAHILVWLVVYARRSFEVEGDDGDDDGGHEGTEKKREEAVDGDVDAPVAAAAAAAGGAREKVE